jgi:hypothetical protein
MKKSKLKNYFICIYFLISYRLIRTQFEDLSNELIYEIFDYFDYIFIYEIFAKFNLRFQSLFFNSLLPLKINFPLTSKLIFQYRCKHFITPNIKRIISLNISKYFLDFFSINLFSSLESLTIHQIQSDKISLILNHLILLPRFSSLSIHSLDYFQDENSIYLSIFNLTKLIFCKLTYPSGGERVPLPISSIHYSRLESLIINGHCRLDQLISILSYTSKLRHLSCQYLYGSGCTEINFSLNLTSICLILYQISFDELKLFLSKISFQLKKLQIKKLNDENYFHAEQWKELIINSLPNLSIFNFQYTLLINNNSYQRLINQFSTNFWIQRKWFFDYYYYKIENSTYLNFFSIIPYKYNHFILYEQINNNKTISFGKNFAHHLTIEGQLRVEEYSIQFPNVNKLILKENSSVIKNLNSIIPLRQITDLDIKDNQFSIEILRLLPNLQCLTLSNIFLLKSKRIKTFRNNKIIKLIIDDDECQLKHIRFLINLFPNLQSIEIGINLAKKYKILLKMKIY